MKALSKQLFFATLRTPPSNLLRMLSSSPKKEFEDAVKLLTSLKEDPGNETKLKLYALYKQATVGKCNISKPGLMDFAGKVKWEAWNNLQDMNQSEAESNYVEIVKKLVEPLSKESSFVDKSSDVISKVEGRVHKIIINRPGRKNALTIEMYDLISDYLEEASKNDTTLAVVTGIGGFYSSGNDLENIFKADPSNYEEHAKNGGELLKRFVTSFIDFPKPLVAVVNGPAIGIMVTTLPLFDEVFASDRATFHTPFSSLAMSPEGCSSFTFPLLMGHTKACDILLFNKKLNAYDAKNVGLVSEVFPSISFQDEVWLKVKKISEFPPENLRLSKSLIRENFRQTLHEVKERECKLLVERWLSQEFKDTMLRLIQNKSNM